MVGGWATGLPKVAAAGWTGLPSAAAAGEPRAARVAVPFGDPGAYARFGGVAT